MEPNLVMGGAATPDEGAQLVPVALAGRVPVKVTSLNGAIKPGDYITTSAIPGWGMKADRAGPVIGRALTGFEAPPEQLNRMGVVIMFVQNGYYNGDGVASLVDASGLEPTEDGPVDIGKQVLGRFMANQEDPLDLGYDQPPATSELYTDRIAAAVEIITPRVVAGEVLTDKLSDVTGSGITVELGPDSSFTLVSSAAPDPATEGTDGEVAGATSEVLTPVITFDAEGNAFFAGQVTAKSVQADTITGLDIFVDRIAVLSDEVAAIGEDDEEVTAQDLINVRDLVALVNDRTGSLSTTVASGDETLLARISADEEAQLTVNSTVAAGLTALDTRLTAAETVITAQAASITDIMTRLTALEAQPAVNLAGLNLSGDLQVNGLATFLGGMKVDSISAMGDILSLMSDTDFIGRPYFNRDTAGFALVHAGDREVRVEFEQPYAVQPIVQADVTFEAMTPEEQTLAGLTDTEVTAAANADEEAFFSSGIRYVITRKSATGFTILLSGPSAMNIRFSWVALAVKDALTDESIGTVVPPEEPIIIAPSPVVEPPPVIEPDPIIEEPPPEEVPPETTEVISEPPPEPTPEPEAPVADPDPVPVTEGEVIE
jgi:hypothetical protein